MGKSRPFEPSVVLKSNFEMKGLGLDIYTGKATELILHLVSKLHDLQWSARRVVFELEIRIITALFFANVGLRFS